MVFPPPLPGPFLDRPDGAVCTNSAVVFKEWLHWDREGEREHIEQVRASPEENMDRRDFLKKSGAVVAGGLLADVGILEQAASAARKPGSRPNIVFILVDEMRFPSVLPAGVDTPAEFLRRYMPNLSYLWEHGVKFENYYTSGNACSPARTTIATGLYPHQGWLLATRTTSGPSLQTGFPTYGRLLRQFGYQTPYFGKWHLSNPPANGSTVGYLEDYGFAGMTNPDPVGTNGQGAEDDVSVIAATAAQWLSQKARGAEPFCATVSLVNPHDKQFFWAGSEGDHYEHLFARQSLVPFTRTIGRFPARRIRPRWGFRRSRRIGSATTISRRTGSQTRSSCSGPSKRRCGAGRRMTRG
jgi:Sulfatase